MNRCSAKLFACLVSCFVLSSASAQGMSEADMQAMMEKAQQMQACMEKIDQSAMTRMQAEGEAMSQEINTLCAAGKRDEAQNKAMAYGMKMAQSDDMAEMRKCMSMMQGMMPGAASPMPNIEEIKNRHVCD